MILGIRISGTPIIDSLLQCIISSCFCGFQQSFNQGFTWPVPSLQLLLGENICAMGKVFFSVEHACFPTKMAGKWWFHQQTCLNMLMYKINNERLTWFSQHKLVMQKQSIFIIL